VFEVDLQTYWKAHPSLGAGAPALKLWPGKLPGNPALPGVTYSRISAPDEETQSAPTGYRDARYQFSVYDDDWYTCWLAAARVKSVFGRYRGMIASTEVQSSRVDNDFDSGDPESGLPRRLIDVVIRHKET
jgi:hypothetical protein